MEDEEEKLIKVNTEVKQEIPNEQFHFNEDGIGAITGEGVAEHVTCC